MNIYDFKKSFDIVFENFINKKLKSIYWKNIPKKYQTILEYACNIPIFWWKRIRPYMCYLWYFIYWGKSIEDIISISISTELLHTMALMQDDIIDRWTSRHNIETTHIFLQKNWYKKFKSHELTFLFSDILYNRSFVPFTQSLSKFPKEKIQKALFNFHDMIDEVIFGEIIDVDIQNKLNWQKKTILSKTYLKTATYTFTRPFLIWASLACEDFLEQDIILLGKYLGIAFQYMDDLLDICWWHKDKTPCSDIQEWQQTIMTWYIMNKWTDDQKTYLQSIFNKNLSKEYHIFIKNFFEQTWAIEYIKIEISKYLQKAQKIIHKLPQNNYAKYILEIIHIIAEKSNIILKN